MSTAEPIFFYDLSSPYAYLAAMRMDEVLPIAPRWQPIVFGAILREVGKTPWSLTPGRRERGQGEVARRARERGLPEVRWPPGWPAESYSLLPLRAVLCASELDAEAGKALTLALYTLEFAHGKALDDIELVIEAARACGLDGEGIRTGVSRAEIKDALRASTTDALSRGVTGVPTLAIGEVLFWGDDRLEDAATALAHRAAPP
jgi:2-hydroxychromene-2-carboxylate isomerase